MFSRGLWEFRGRGHSRYGNQRKIHRGSTIGFGKSKLRDQSTLYRKDFLSKDVVSYVQKRSVFPFDEIIRSLKG